MVDEAAKFCQAAKSFSLSAKRCRVSAKNLQNHQCNCLSFAQHLLCESATCETCADLARMPWFVKPACQATGAMMPKVPRPLASKAAGVLQKEGGV